MLRIRSTRRKIILLTTSLIALAVATGTVWYLANNRPLAVDIPKSVLDKSLFTVYVPASLPDGYSITKGSFDNSDGVLVFSIQNKQGGAIAVSEQGAPSGFDFTSFYNKQMRDPKKLSGQFEAVVGQVTGQGSTDTILLSVRADSTWVMATAKSTSRNALEYLAEHLAKYN